MLSAALRWPLLIQSGHTARNSSDSLSLLPCPFNCLASLTLVPPSLPETSAATTSQGHSLIAFQLLRPSLTCQYRCLVLSGNASNTSHAASVVIVLSFTSASRAWLMSVVLSHDLLPFSFRDIANNSFTGLMPGGFANLVQLAHL